MLIGKHYPNGWPTIAAQLHSQLRQLQHVRRQGLLMQLRAIQFLTRQGTALRGHKESEGNLHQLLLMWTKNDEILQTWLRENRYTSHRSVNELITILGQSLLRSLLDKMKEPTGSAWFSIIADEATDVVSSEQLNLTIRWVSNSYEVHENPVGLFRVPDTTAETLFTVIKDMLIRCSLPLSLCRGQAYDGASNMQGRRSGVATRFRNEQPAAIPVHCFAHSLNLCLQDAGTWFTSEMP